MKKAEPLFCIQRDGETVAGPYDLVQMARLLRKKIITPETLTRLEGEDDWKPFSWRPEFMVAKEMSPDAVSMRVEALDEEAAAKASGPIPLPSRETVIRLVAAGVCGLVAAFLSFALAWLDSTLGTCVVVIGVALAAVAQCLIVVRMLDEDAWTWSGLMFVPMYDVYYLICNFSVYAPWLFLKYVGAAVAMGALIGLAMHGAR